MQPIVVRAIPDAAPGAPARYQLVMGERRWRAAQQAGLDDHPGDRPRNRRGQPASRRLAGEHPPRAVEPSGRGGGLSAAARGVRRHPRRTRRPDRTVASGDHQHDPAAPAADRRPAPGGRRGVVGRTCPSAAGAGGRPGGPGGTRRPHRGGGVVGACHRGGRHAGQPGRRQDTRPRRGASRSRCRGSRTSPSGSRAPSTPG